MKSGSRVALKISLNRELITVTPERVFLRHVSLYQADSRRLLPDDCGEPGHFRLQAGPGPGPEHRESVLEHEVRR